MKRHLRIVIDDSTVIGHLLKKSNWFPSRPFECVTLACFKPTFDDQLAFGDRVSAMLGFDWKPYHCAFSGYNHAASGVQVHILEPIPPTKWLALNASGRWLACTTTYHDELGWRRQDVKFWFQDEIDATLFAVAYP